jgi:beta-galactosidase
VALWELSLNETPVDEPFMGRLQAIGHEEYPGDQMFTCGWMDRYDVFVHSRQHGQIHRWINGDKALVIAEYGDWEFYATNAGFDQTTDVGVFDRWSNSRQFRGAGERGLRQQVFNHSLALNDTLTSPAVLDGLWVMFDHARGYAPVRAADGVMDIFRLPKFSYHFYRSQRDPQQAGAGWSVGPVAFIASHWTPASDLRVLVFSNCEEVELRLTAPRSIGDARRRPRSPSICRTRRSSSICRGSPPAHWRQSAISAACRKRRTSWRHPARSAGSSWSLTTWPPPPPTRRRTCFSPTHNSGMRTAACASTNRRP